MRPACPKCGESEKYGGECRTGRNLDYVVYFGPGTLAYTYCFNCGYQEAAALEPEPWPEWVTFPMSDEQIDRFLDI